MDVDELLAQQEISLPLFIASIFCYTLFVSNKEQGDEDELFTDELFCDYCKANVNIISLTNAIPNIEGTPVAKSRLESELVKWQDGFKKFQYYLEDTDLELFNSANKCFMFWWLEHAVKSLNISNLLESPQSVINTGLLAAALRCHFFRGAIAPNADSLSNNLAIPSKLLVELAYSENIDQISIIADREFFSEHPSAAEKLGIAHASLMIFLMELNLVIRVSSGKYVDTIRYKTNANISEAMNELEKHITLSGNCLELDPVRHRINVHLTCREANAHKAVVLLINEFERALSGYEFIFSSIGFRAFYMRAVVSSSGSDHVSNYNFEAYTPTLMPLLSGGHLYASELVFIRELVQNAVDSINVRKLVDPDYFPDDIKVNIGLGGHDNSLSALKIIDSGLGMGCGEIERYLTSIGRSFYTSGDFKKLNLAYRPVSSFGIGFLSCFLVSKSITIHTHRFGEPNSYELTIPNIEGCFFIEASREDYPVGTAIEMDMSVSQEKPTVSLDALIEYADSHLLDIEFDVRFSWTGKFFSKFILKDSSGSELSVISPEIIELANTETHRPPTQYAFLRDAILTGMDRSYDFHHTWWNKYLRGKLKGIELHRQSDNISNHTVRQHAIRQIGERFFMFLPFVADGSVPSEIFDNVEDTYKYPYGMFITDAPLAGKKMRNRSNGLSPHSGVLRFLNAGILIDEATMRPIFGQDMKIYADGAGTAFNNVFINFPPNWITLNISRDKVLGLDAVNKMSLIHDIADVALQNIEAILHGNRSVPLVNIKEIANFISILCVDLNKTPTGKMLQTNLKEHKYVLSLVCLEDGIQFKITKDVGKDMDMKTWFMDNSSTLESISKPKTTFLADEFFRSFEAELHKDDLESLEELAFNLLSRFSQFSYDNPDTMWRLPLLLFATYILYFPPHRIVQYSSRASHCRHALEWLFLRRFTSVDFSKGNACELITYEEILQAVGNDLE